VSGVRVVSGALPHTRLCDYEVETPDAPAPAAGWPWVLCLHGMAQSGAEMRRESVALGHPRLARVFADGPHALEKRDAATGERRRAFAWYVYTGPGAAFTRELALAEAHVVALARRAVREHPLDPRRGALLGYSQGAYLAGFVAFRNPELFRGGVVLASGRLKDEILGPEMAAATDLRVLIAHGERDRFVPFEFAERGLSALERAGSRAARLARLPGGHAFSPDVQREALAFLMEGLA
jgi:predicted esterase